MIKNESDLKIKMDSMLSDLVNILPDSFTGNREIMKQKLRMKYGQKDCNRYILEEKKSLMKSYLILTASFLLLLFLTIPQLYRESEEIKRIEKPAPGEAAVTIPIEAKMDYKGIEVSKSFDLNISPKELSEKEKEQVLKKFAQQLPSRILGKNADLNQVSEPLNLIEYDRNTGITIVWSSSNPEVIHESGAVDLIAAERQMSVTLTARLTMDGINREEVITITFDKNASSVNYSVSMEKRLSAVIDRLGDDGAAAYIQLPGSLPEGMDINWHQKKENSFGLILLIYGVLLLILYGKRYEKIDKEMKAARASVEKDLPEFISKLVLLLNAGLVFSSAYAKIVEDYERNAIRSKDQNKKGKKRHLYAELLEIQKRVEKTQTPLIFELKDFSQRCGVRDMIRLTAIISDNWNKGSTLAEKMEREGELMWIGRKKKAEEKGKLAETKLTFPLTILLLVLIMITVAPALLGM